MGDLIKALLTNLAQLAAQELPTGPGAVDVVRADLAQLADAMTQLSTETARRMAYLDTQDPRGADTVRTLTVAGVNRKHAQTMRAAALFANRHASVESAWRARTVTTDQVAAVAAGARRLDPDQATTLVDTVLDTLPGLSLPDTRRVLDLVIDQLSPNDPDYAARRDYRNRHLVWSQYHGGLLFKGFLPDLEAGAFKAVIDAYVESLRTEGDEHTMAQRRADALAALVAKASADGVPTGGGLPAAVTLTVSLTEAERIADTNPDQIGDLPPRPRPTPTSGFSDSATRFAMCCAEITPVLAQQHDPNSLLAKIGKTRIDPIAVGRAVRLATAGQRKALHLRDGGCLAPGCSVDAPYTQPHHVVGYALGGSTCLSNLASLCWAHHRQVELGLLRVTKTADGSWTITPRGP